MKRVSEIGEQIMKLTPVEFVQFRIWFMELDAQIWDRKIEADAASGKLDEVFKTDLAEHLAGKSREL